MAKLPEFRQLREKAGLEAPQAARLLGYNVRTIQRYDSGQGQPRKATLDRLRQLAPHRGFAYGEQKLFSFVDLFAGIGGLRLGFEAIGGRCIATAEWNKYARLTYEANFMDGEDHEFFGDLQKVPPSEIPPHDVLLAGFPCQPFSIAGVSKKNALGRPHGFACEEQGNLFFKLAEIIGHHRPLAFLLENVKNLERHDKGNTFRVIRDVLENQLGYKIRTRVIDARHWVPQHRERIFIVGFREDVGFDERSIQIPGRELAPKLGDILERESDIPEKYTLTRHLWDYLQRYAEKHKAKGNGFGFGRVGPEDITRTLSARYFKDGSEILVKQKRSARPRRLTPRECARLMGFEYGPRSEWNIPVSDTQAYKQFGNAVVVPVVQAVAHAMQPHILKLKAQSEQFALPLSAAE